MIIGADEWIQSVVVVTRGEFCHTRPSLSTIGARSTNMWPFRSSPVRVRDQLSVCWVTRFKCACYRLVGSPPWSNISSRAHRPESSIELASWLPGYPPRLARDNRFAFNLSSYALVEATLAPGSTHEISRPRPADRPLPSKSRLKTFCTNDAHINVPAWINEARVNASHSNTASSLFQLIGNKSHGYFRASFILPRISSVG